MSHPTESLQKIQLTEVRETLLITLYTRALDYREPRPILGDRFADELVQRIDYDFARTKLNRNDAVAIAMRARHLDDWVRDFLGQHPEATVVHLACGLDSRVFRINPPSPVLWFDVDFPDIIALRQRFYPPRGGYQMIGSSVTDPHWLAGIPTDRPVMVVAEGLTMYLSEAEIQALLNRLTRHFTAGGEIAFDVFNGLASRLAAKKAVMRHTGAVFKWTIDDPQAVTRLNPALQFAEEVPVLASPYLKQANSFMRIACGVLSLFPPLKNMGRLLRFRFGPR